MDTTLISTLRAAAERYMTQTCVIEAQRKGVGRYREETPVWDVVAQGVKCRVITVGQRASNDMVQARAQESLRDMYRLICPVGTALDVNQRITVDGATYNVVSLITARTDSTDVQAVMERMR